MTNDKVMGQPTAASFLHLGKYDEKQVHDVAAKLLAQVGGTSTFGVVFATPDYMEHLSDFLETLRLYAHIPTLAGCSAQNLIGQEFETYNDSGFSLLLANIPGCEAKPVFVSREMVEEKHDRQSWQQIAGLRPEQVFAWLMFANPFHLPIETLLEQWNMAYPGVPTVGGLAAGRPSAPEAWVYCNDRLVEGAVGIALCGTGMQLHTVVSQGCKPIGEPLTVTSAENNVLYRLGSKPALQALNEAYDMLSDSDKQGAPGHIFAGIALNEYVEEFKRGDFLIRNILAADPQTGAIAIGAFPRIGQTLQYQLRDTQAASEDFHAMLAAKALELGDAGTPFAGLMCSCSGRGRHLFGSLHHDALAVAKYFPGLPLAGFFGNGEIGPIGSRNFIHGYTASVALICAEKQPAAAHSKQKTGN